MVHLLQITDTHLFAKPDGELYHVNTRNSLRAVIEHASQNLPQIDVLLVTGDLVHDESREGYVILNELVQVFDKPAYYVPGNHDNLALMQQLLINTPKNGLITCEQDGWSIVLLDSAIHGKVEGELTQDTLNRLEQYLDKYRNNHILIALHHHAIEVHSQWLDKLNLRNHKQLIRLVEAYSNVRLVINGHIHQEMDVQRNAIRYLGTPATCFQFAPRQATAGIDSKPPGYRYIGLDNDGSVDTKVFYVEDYGG